MNVWVIVEIIEKTVDDDPQYTEYTAVMWGHDVYTSEEEARKHAEVESNAFEEPRTFSVRRCSLLDKCTIGRYGRYYA